MVYYMSNFINIDLMYGKIKHFVRVFYRIMRSTFF